MGNDQSFRVEADAESGIKPAERAPMLEFQTKVNRLQRSVVAAGEAATNGKTRLAAIRRALIESAADVKLMDEAAELDRRLTVLQRRLRGDETLRGLESGSPSSIQSRVASVSNGIRGMISAPTGTQQANYQLAADDFTEVYGRLRTLIETDLPRFEQRLDAAEVPHTPGRMPAWK
jgi:hypothetical protein